MTEKKQLKVKSIRNGTVIDHITANRALSVLNILNLPDNETSMMVAINVESPDMEFKDIVKIENRELSSSKDISVSFVNSFDTAVLYKMFAALMIVFFSSVVNFIF